jgi:hypothetical protein
VSDFFGSPLPEPLIRHLIVGGLKSYGRAAITVPLAPLTLVFGPNSAGKSSLLSTLTLLRQSIVSEKPFQLRTRGDLVDVGTFRQAVHQHDPDGRITLGLGFTAPNPGQPSLVSADTVRELSFAYSWDNATQRPGGTGFTVVLDGNRTSFDVDATGRYEGQDHDSDWQEFLRALVVSQAARVSKAARAPLAPIQAQPVIRRRDDDDPLGALAHGDPLAAIRLGLSVQLHAELSDVLSRISYIGPIRARPDRASSLSTTAYHYVGPEGEHTTEVLADHPDLVERTNEWFGKLGLGYQVKILMPDIGDVAITAGDFAVLGLVDVRDETPTLVSARAVGYGISQLTPIVAQALLSERGMLLIEQPEVHIHPRLQAQVGDLLIHSVRERGNQVLVETHSEHLVLRLLRRVREGVLAPADLAVLYVDMLADGSAHVRRLDVDSAGDLIEGWPGGFFDERLEEVLGRSW